MTRLVTLTLAATVSVISGTTLSGCASAPPPPTKVELQQEKRLQTLVNQKAVNAELSLLFADKASDFPNMPSEEKAAYLTHKVSEIDRIKRTYAPGLSPKNLASLDKLRTLYAATNRVIDERKIYDAMPRKQFVEKSAQYIKVLDAQIALAKFQKSTMNLDKLQLVRRHAQQNGKILVALNSLTRYTAANPAPTSEQPEYRNVWAKEVQTRGETLAAELHAMQAMGGPVDPQFAKIADGFTALSDLNDQQLLLTEKAKALQDESMNIRDIAHALSIMKRRTELLTESDQLQKQVNAYSFP